MRVGIVMIIELKNIRYQGAAGFRVNKSLKDWLTVSDDLRSSMTEKDVS
jgi:hypothetical protein